MGDSWLRIEHVMDLNESSKCFNWFRTNEMTRVDYDVEILNPRFRLLI
jgi:hypothetical protein